MDWQYITGFFDGEGGTHIGYSRAFKAGKYYKTPRLQITMVNTNKSVLEKISSFLRASGIVCGIYHQRQKPPRGTSFSLRITSLEALDQFISHVEPFVIAKADVFRIVKETLAFMKNRHPSKKSRVRWNSNDLAQFDELVCRHATFIKKGRRALTY